MPGAEPIDVDNKNEVVKLSGTVPSETARAQAIEVVSETPGVKQIKDEFKVHPGK